MAFVDSLFVGCARLFPTVSDSRLKVSQFALRKFHCGANIMNTNPG